MDIARLLFQGGACTTIRNEDGRLALHLAGTTEDAQVVDLLITEDGQEVNQADENRWTALHFGAFYGNTPFVERLLARGANVEARTGGWAKPLHLAAQYGHPIIVGYLLAANAEVNAPDANRCTPLHWAAGYRDDDEANQWLTEEPSIDVIQELLEYNANIYLENNAQQTALDISQKQQHDGIAQILRRAIDLDQAQKELLSRYIAEYLYIMQDRADEGDLEYFKNLLKETFPKTALYELNQPTGRIFNVPRIRQLEERYMNGQNLECGFLGLGLNGRQGAAAALLEAGGQNNAQGTEVRALMGNTIYDVLAGDPREWPQELREAMAQPNMPYFRDILKDNFRLGEGHLFGQVDDYGNVQRYLEDNRTESPLWRWITNWRVFELFVRGYFARPTTMLTFYGYDGQGARMHGMLDALARARKVQVVIWQGDEATGLEEIYRTAEPAKEGFEVIHLRFIGNEGIGHFNRLMLRNEAQAAPAAIARNFGQRTACPTPTPWPTPQPSVAIVHETLSNYTGSADREGQELLMINNQLLKNGIVYRSYDR